MTLAYDTIYDLKMMLFCVVKYAIYRILTCDSAMKTKLKFFSHDGIRDNKLYNYQWSATFVMVSEIMCVLSKTAYD